MNKSFLCLLMFRTLEVGDDFFLRWSACAVWKGSNPLSLISTSPNCLCLRKMKPFSFSCHRENNPQCLLPLSAALQTQPVPPQICMGTSEQKWLCCCVVAQNTLRYHSVLLLKTGFILFSAWVPPNIIFISLGANLAFQGTELMLIQSIISWSLPPDSLAFWRSAFCCSSKEVISQTC